MGNEPLAAAVKEAVKPSQTVWASGWAVITGGAAGKALVQLALLSLRSESKAVDVAVAVLRPIPVMPNGTSA